MRASLAPDVIRMWEAGRDQGPIERTLTLLSLSGTEASRDELAALSIGQRDERLLDLRQRMFGDALSAFSECPHCAERLEIHFSSGTIPRAEGEAPPILEMKGNGTLVRFRLPTSTDLAEATATGESEAARETLLRRCLVDARSDAGDQIPTGELSEEIIVQVVERMAAAEPAAEVLLQLLCPFCGHSWEALFDIAAFFWKEISASARRLLQEVDAIARVYGWSEAEILGLSPVRRQAYLELIGA